MNKTQLVKDVAERIQYKKSVVKTVLESIIASISDALRHRETVQLMGFGSFKVKRRNARRGHLPGSTEEILLEATNVAAFSAGNELRGAIQDPPTS